MTKLPAVLLLGAVLLLSLALWRALAAFRHQRRRQAQREAMLDRLLVLAQALRKEATPQALFEALARELQAACGLRCAVVARIGRSGQVQVACAVGASGRRLLAAESLSLAWNDWLPLLSDERQIAPGVYRAAQLPFRTSVDELHLVLPLEGQRGEPLALLTASWPLAEAEQALDTLPALRMLAMQLTMALDACALQSSGDFVAVAAHELRTPLTAVRGYADLLLLGTAGPLNDGQHAFLAVIKRNVVRQIELIDELLDIARIEAGEVPLRCEPLQLGEVVREVLESLGGEFAARSIVLGVDLPEALPPVLADRHRCSQILINLVGNACKYTPHGGNVRVRLRTSGDGVLVEVCDNGVGISELAKPRIFGRFFRADNPLRDQVQGTGLGLAITKSLVEQHGGRIWFESQEGQGSTFAFTLPLEQVP